METSNKFDLGLDSHGKTVPLRMYKILQTHPLFVNYAEKSWQSLDRVDMQEIAKLFEDNYATLKELFQYDGKPLHETLKGFDKLQLGTSRSFYSSKMNEIMDTLLKKDLRSITMKIRGGMNDPEQIKCFSENAYQKKLVSINKKFTEDTFISTMINLMYCMPLEVVDRFTQFFNDVNEDKLVEILKIAGDSPQDLSDIIRDVNPHELAVYIEQSKIEMILQEMKDPKSLILALNS